MTQAFNLSQLANKVNTSGQLDASTGLVNTTPAANGGTGKSTNTAGTLLLGAGTSAMTELTGGTTNNVVAWSGTAWASVPGISVAGGDYVLTTYQAPAVYVKPATLKAVKVTVVGGGGNGGSAGGGNNASAGSGGGGGGNGGAAIKYLDAPAIPFSPVAITAGSGTNSLGAFVSATGGANGSNGTFPATPIVPGASGTGTGGNLNFIGNGVFNPAAGPAPGTRVGQPAANYGGGGGGAASQVAPAPVVPGGTGSLGIVIIEEFY